MKKWISIFSIIVTISSFTFAQTPKPQTAPKEKPAAEAADKNQNALKEFTPIIAEYYKAWNTLNLDMPAKYYAKDPSLVFYDVAPLKYNGWKEYQSGVKKLLEGYSSFKLIPGQDLQATRKGKIAWTTITFRLSAKEKNGTAAELDCRHTAIWEKRKGSWIVVHEHVSAPLPPPPAK
jgi:ketosteroid isomerase-like protein